MCLASEAGKMDTAVSQPENSSSTESLRQTTIKPEIKEEKADADLCPSSSHTSALLPSPSSVTSTSTDAIVTQLSSQNARVKKSKKKDVARPNEDDEVLCSEKKIVKCNLVELNVDSVCSTIEAVAKGAWIDTEGKPTKKIPSTLIVGNSGLPKKKSKPKAKAFIIENKGVLDDSSRHCGQYTSSEVKMKIENADVSPQKEEEEEEEANIESTDLQGCMAAPHHSPCSHSPAKLKEEDKGKERSSDASCESNPENRGSRKSERSCKGALYKTLVSEGMLTSLRANIDRGMKQDAVYVL